MQSGKNCNKPRLIQLLDQFFSLLFANTLLGSTTPCWETWRVFNGMNLSALQQKVKASFETQVGRTV